MKDHKHIIAAAVVTALAALLFTSFAPASVFAGSNKPVTVDIPVTYIVNGNEETAEGDRFTLTADDPASPMPDGSEAGKKTITIRKEGTYSFGNMYYDWPGVHWYTVTREVTQKKGVVKDDSVYRAKVIALNDGHGYVLVYRKGSDKKQELVYTDKTAPETGDASDLVFYCGVALASAAVFAIMTAVKKKKNNTRQCPPPQRK